MQTRQWLYYFVLLTLLLFSKPTFSTEYVGGDIYYECIDIKPSTRPYLLRVNLFVECGTIDLGNSIEIFYYAPSLGITASSPRSFFIDLESSRNLNLYCIGDQGSRCSGGTGRDIYEYKYVGQVDFIDLGYAPDFTFYYADNSLSSHTDNIENPSNAEFKLEINWNNSLSACNRSPQFNTGIFTACVGEEFSLPALASNPDTEGDLISYTFVSPLNTTFAAPFSASSFMAMNQVPQFNPSGGFSFTPTEVMSSMVGVRVDEYKGGSLLSSSVKVLQFDAIDCINEAPELSNWDVNSADIGTDTIVLCAGDVLSGDILGLDADLGQFLDIDLVWTDGNSNWVNIINDKTENPHVEFRANTRTNEKGFHHFRLKITDNSCPNTASSTKVVTVNLLEAPEFTLGLDKDVRCDALDTLSIISPTGNEPYTYQWSTGATDTEIYVGLGSYSLTVTDNNGCRFTDDIEVVPGLNALYTIEDRCLNDVTQFLDVSSSSSSTIVRWTWDFGDGFDTTYTSYSSQISHLIQPHVVGEYTARLIVEDDVDCRDTLIIPYEICAPYDVLIDTSISRHCDSYQTIFRTESKDDNGMAGEDRYEYGCGIRTNEWNFGNGTTGNGYYGSTEYDTAGIYQITAVMETFAGCTARDTIILEINKTIDVNIIENDYLLDCTQTDTTLQTEILIDSNDSILYDWSWTYLDSLMNPVQYQSTDSNLYVIPQDVAQAGSQGLKIYLTTHDANFGCESIDSITIYFPIQADFRWTPFCREGDLVHFDPSRSSVISPSVFSNDRYIQSYSWDFGDNTTAITSRNNPLISHEYQDYGIQTATLKVTDQTGCSDSIAYEIMATPILLEYAILPNTINHCATDVLQLIGNKEDISKGWNNVDSSFWLLDGLNYSDFSNTSYVSNVEDTFILAQHIYYNYSSLIDSGCAIIEQSPIMYYPEFDIKIGGIDRFCLFETVTFNPIRTINPDVPFDESSFVWTITWNPDDPDTLIYHGRNPQHTFTGWPLDSIRSYYRIKLEAKDIYGCYQETDEFPYASRVVTPQFTATVVCANELTHLRQNFTDSLNNLIPGHASYFWEINHTDTIWGDWPIEDLDLSLEEAGNHSIILTIIDSIYQCNNTYTGTIEALPFPTADFSSDGICPGKPLTLTNQSIPGTNAILNQFKWALGDIDTVITNRLLENVVYENIPSNPPDSLTLIAYNNLGCTDTTRKDIEKLEIPRAGIVTRMNTGKPCPSEYYNFNQGVIFRDSSTYEESPIATWDWDFGDYGSSRNSNAKNPNEHIYDTAQVYDIMLVVRNELGCVDTLIQELDILDLWLCPPDVFPPNAIILTSNTNRSFIVRILESHIAETIDLSSYWITIHDRWGERVFEYKSPEDEIVDVDAIEHWDGSYLDDLVSTGAYVYRIKYSYILDNYLKQKQIFGRITVIY